MYPFCQLLLLFSQSVVSVCLCKVLCHPVMRFVISFQETTSVQAEKILIYTSPWFVNSFCAYRDGLDFIVLLIMVNSYRAYSIVEKHQQRQCLCRREVYPYAWLFMAFLARPVSQGLRSSRMSALSGWLLSVRGSRHSVISAVELGN